MLTPRTAPLSPGSLTASGAFAVGCNYWASHAGTRMWADWQPAVVDDDLRRLRAAGLQLLRVFPLWPDFQPITRLYACSGEAMEIRHGDAPLPDTPRGQAGLSEGAMARFAEFLDLLAGHGLAAIVGLLTGWMSGRLFVPSALEGREILTDPEAILWQLRFVREFVAAFRAHPAIAGWDLGNECNCLGTATREQAWTWTATIANAIRAVDATRPVVSGMHGLSPAGAWRMQDQGELTDLLTTHPYPAFTPHCNLDPLPTFRPILHSTAESCYYADLGGKPCLCQEIGTLGPMFAGERVAADYARACLFSLWAHDCHGFLWWCASDQAHLDHPPYDWMSMERELGLLRRDGTPKPVLNELTRFRALLDALPFDRLPRRACQAVCLLTHDQDHWGTAYSTFLLAKQAGFDLTFQLCDAPLPAAPLYLLPGLSGPRILPRRRQLELLERVRAGATLYLSLDDGLPALFEEMTGLAPQTRARRTGAGAVARLSGLPGALDLPLANPFVTAYTPTRAAVLGREDDGNPLFTVAPFGAGQVYFLSQPIERWLTQTPGVFHLPPAPAVWQLYRHVAGRVLAERAVRKTCPLLGITEHPWDDGGRTVVAVNLSPSAIEERLEFTGGRKLQAVHAGDIDRDGQCRIPGNDALIFSISSPSH